MGVPAQWGPVVNRVVGSGRFTRADLQQICWLQSALVWQVLAQVVLQTPLQQISLLAVLQSLDCVQIRGQGSYVGLRQTPPALTCGSIWWMEVQQISPLAVLQSLLAPHDFGHCEGATQNGWS
jgi:hypothetical protein